VKRTFDVAVSLVALVVTSPLLAAAAVAVKLESPGPAFYSGRRAGRDGREFRIFKLRSMRSGSAGGGPAVTAADDPRITRVGRFLRRTKIDELPQLVNVLKGEMSLVGPRPEDPVYLKYYTPEQRRLLTVRPGITGPASVAFVHEEELLKGGSAEERYVADVMPRKLDLELAYVDHATFVTDLRILIRTAGAILRPRQSPEASGGSPGRRR
jgi:lipopolysaccharide/colanic/teichoic acid biosynthesis glycosyltransferase